MRELLADFSKVGLWGDSLRSSRVRILQSGDPAPSAAVRVARAPARARVQSKPVPIGYPEVIRGPAVEQPPPGGTLNMLPPHILMEPGVLNFLENAGVDIPEEIQELYGSAMLGLPENQSLPSYVWHDPMFRMFLEANGIEPPQ